MKFKHQPSMIRLQIHLNASQQHFSLYLADFNHRREKISTRIQFYASFLHGRESFEHKNTRTRVKIDSGIFDHTVDCGVLDPSTLF